MVSRFLHDRVKEGDELPVTAPSGYFTFTGKESDSIVPDGGRGWADANDERCSLPDRPRLAARYLRSLLLQDLTRISSSGRSWSTCNAGIRTCTSLPP